MGLTKEEIIGRLQTESHWILTTRTLLFTAAIAENKTRYVVAIWIKGNRRNAEDITFERLNEDGTYSILFSPIPIGPADFRQLPEGSYNVEDPILRIEGGEQLYGTVGGHVGTSLNTTINYWDNEL